MSIEITTGLTTDIDALAVEAQQTPLDAIIIGGGSAGISAARTLAEDGTRRIALFEAGRFSLLNHISNTGLRFEPKAARAVQTLLQYAPPMADGTAFGNLIGCMGGRGMFWNGAAPNY